MKLFIFPIALAALSACGESNDDLATYTCPNGPNIAVTYSEEGARLLLTGGRVEELPPTETENIYAKPGIVWNAAGFRTARLTDGDKSFQCDQMAG
ncbi:MAG: hypothetical protein AAF689_18620 [Pseudomonadota bacterium]